MTKKLDILKLAWVTDPTHKAYGKIYPPPTDPPCKRTLINALKTKINQKYKYTISSYRAVNKHHLGYKNSSVDFKHRNNRRLRVPSKHINVLRGQNGEMLKCYCSWCNSFHWALKGYTLQYSG